MGIPAAGSVILINFPYADLRSYKKRPAVVVAHGSLETLILCQITSRDLPGVRAIEITQDDFIEGSLPVISYVRPDKLFTVDSTIAKNNLGTLKVATVRTICRQVSELFV